MTAELDSVTNLPSSLDIAYGNILSFKLPNDRIINIRTSKAYLLEDGYGGVEWSDDINELTKEEFLSIMEEVWGWI